MHKYGAPIIDQIDPIVWHTILNHWKIRWIFKIHKVYKHFLCLLVKLVKLIKYISLLNLISLEECHNWRTLPG